MNDSYVLGRSAGETDRLQLQASIYASASTYLFSRARISAGMRVLDVGCGADDVSMLLAELVGPTGSVIGVDMNPVILDLARARVANAGLDNVSFIVADLTKLRLDEPIDALAGRLILLHLKEPAATLRALTRLVVSGGVVSFQEFNVTTVHAVPPTPLITSSVALIVGAMNSSGANPDGGVASIMRDAGLAVDGTATIAQAGSAESDLPEYVAISVRSLLPVMVAHDLTTEADVDVETLSGRLTEELRRACALFQVPEVTAALARIP